MGRPVTLSNGDCTGFTTGVHGVHATVLTSDLDFFFAGSLFKHFGQAPPCR
jgi:hypothetical protein